ncbi:hypothetical protein [Sphingomonas sp.]|uniref:hypothetical protein n=1 Tax=Sphingomonas sp. TaxID=28214 RepID=UPI002C44B41D|nr:hypothetical protein [Sphingomonas sp.]HTG38582.1 hypothetical protein [Sphingomonas sp.]
MLAGLIFATEAAEDRAEALAATLPFGGMTLIEYQARLLIGCGAGHILIAVARVTPALLAAVNRITRRGVAVDIVRSAEEAAAKAHPLASIVVVADALVTTDQAMRAIAGAQPDTLMVTSDATTPAAVERVDADHVWAGLAALSPTRLKELAAMPREYDFQSTLLRVSVQGGAAVLPLPAGARRAGHGVERHVDTLASRSNAVLAALANGRTDWPDRFVFTPVSRLALPRLAAKGTPHWVVPAVAALLAIAALALIGWGRPGGGVVAGLAGIAALSTGSLLSWLRGEDRRAQAQERAIAALSGVLMLGVGMQASAAAWTATALVLALVTVAAATLVERAAARAAWWWGSPSAYPLLLAPFSLSGLTSVGLAVTAAYAMATLAAALEKLREKP